jgi:signal transduction histidine kinase
MTEGHSFTFPDEPRGDLDKALDDLMSRARDVLETQGRLRALLKANRAIIEHLDLSVVLERIVEAAVELVGAQYGALGVVSAEGGLEQFINVGMTPEQVAIIGHLPRGHGLLGAVIDNPHPIRIPLIAAHELSVGFPPNHPPMTSFLGVPVRVRDEVYGNLYLTNQKSGAFTDEDEQLVTALAATAGVAIENARLFAEVSEARSSRQKLALLEDRGRIARDLHDHVIQQLFGTGLELQNIAGSTSDAVVKERIVQSVAQLDASISQIRTVIFALTVSSDDPRSAVRHAIIDLANELAPSLAGTPAVSFSGPVDLVVTETLAEDVIAVTREALTNVVRHAAATRTSIDLRVADGAIVLTVTDNGSGISKAKRHSGLANLEQRAQLRGGAMSITSGATGTILRWSVPLSAQTSVTS